MRVLVGVQPTFTHVPPTHFFSIRAVFQPLAASFSARGFAACPEPIIIASYLFISKRLCFLRADFYPLPESDIVFDLFCRVLWRRVIPGRVVVRLTVHLDVEIGRLPLPGADGMRPGSGKEFLLYRAGWKIVIVLYDDRVIAFGNDGSIPARLHA